MRVHARWPGRGGARPGRGPAAARRDHSYSTPANVVLGSTPPAPALPRREIVLAGAPARARRRPPRLRARRAAPTARAPRPRRRGRTRALGGLPRARRAADASSPAHAPPAQRPGLQGRVGRVVSAERGWGARRGGCRPPRPAAARALPRGAGPAYARRAGGAGLGGGWAGARAAGGGRAAPYAGGARGQRARWGVGGVGGRGAEGVGDSRHLRGPRSGVCTLSARAPTGSIARPGAASILIAHVEFPNPLVSTENRRVLGSDRVDHKTKTDGCFHDFLNPYDERQG